MIPQSLRDHPFSCALRQLGPRVVARHQGATASDVTLAGEVRGRLLLGYVVKERAATAGMVSWSLHNGLDANAPELASGWLSPEESDNQPLYGVEAFNGLFLHVITGTVSLTLYEAHDSQREHMIDFVDSDDRADVFAGAGVG